MSTYGIAAMAFIGFCCALAFMWFLGDYVRQMSQGVCKNESLAIAVAYPAFWLFAVMFLALGVPDVLSLPLGFAIATAIEEAGLFILDSVMRKASTCAVKEG